MPDRACRLLIAASLVVASSPLAAQTGSGSAGVSLTPRVECAYLYRDSGSGATEQHWLVALVLWRGQAGWRARAGATEATRHAYRIAARAAEDAGRHFVGGHSGGFVYAAAYDHDSLYVLGRSYLLPRRDSALVVMVDRVDSVDGNPAVVGTANVEAQVAPEFWIKQWASGDTLFIVRPHQPERILLEALRRAPRLGQFLE